MFEHLSAPAQQAIDQAEHVAHRLAHHYIGTEHVLVGLTRLPGSGAQRALAACAIEADRLEAQLEELLGRGQTALSVRPPFTSSAMVVLERARWEARQGGMATAGTAHLLLALMRLPLSTAATVLRGMGVDPATVAAEAERRARDPAADRGLGAEPADRTARADAAGASGCPPAVDPIGIAPAEEEPMAIQLGRLRREVTALRDELTRLTAMVQELRREGSPAPPGVAADPEPRSPA
jgi:ATP-dependent Clp protease ATP-binding subunit ClpA